MSFTESSQRDAKNRRKKEDFLTKNPPFECVMCFGTFDLFHPGHIYYLSEAEKLASSMVVVIARDHRVFSGKGRDPIHDETSRMQSVQDHFPSARVILGHESDIFAPIREIGPDLLAFGYDQRVPEEKIHELFPDVEIVRIAGHEPEKHKSSLLREKLIH